jgi:hypothetical protein
LAVSTRAEARFTRDADLAVLVGGDEDAESLVRDLQARGHRVVAAIEQQPTGRLATVRLVPLGQGDDETVVDLLFASSGIEPEIVAAAESLQVAEGLRTPVARTGHLIALKVLSRDDRTRPQDRSDLVALLSYANELARREARDALRLIGERGFARGRDLLADFATLIAEHDSSQGSGA